MSTRYKGDPYWLTARFTSRCNRCQEVIVKGEKGLLLSQNKISIATSLHAAKLAPVNSKPPPRTRIFITLNISFCVPLSREGANQRS